MILADTSVWVDHLRNGNPGMQERLRTGRIACHAMVLGELACGNLKRRKEILALLHALPDVERGEDDEVLFFVEHHRLHGSGLGLVDVHLLASCHLAGTPLWTLDNRLKRAARDLSIAQMS